MSHADTRTSFLPTMSPTYGLAPEFTMSSILFELRLEGLRVLAADPAAYPRWLLAQGTLFVLLKQCRSTPSAWVVREAERLSVTRAELAGARKALAVVALSTRGRGGVTYWQLPPGLEVGLDLARFDQRWQHYLW